jgi:hypothetical protein
LKITEVDQTFIARANGLEADITQKMKDIPEIEKIFNETIDNYLTTEMKDKGRSNFIVDIVDIYIDNVFRYSYTKLKYLLIFYIQSISLMHIK